MRLLALDAWLFGKIYGAGGEAVIWISAGITHLGTRGAIWVLLALACAIWGRGLTRRTGFALGATLLAHLLLLELLIKGLVARTRPWKALGVPLLDTLVNPYSYSFPSGHTASAFACAWVLGVRFPRYRIPLLGLAGLIGLSRVHLGAHYPSDVLAGAVVGVGLGYAVARAFRLHCDTVDGD